MVEDYLPLLRKLDIEVSALPGSRDRTEIQRAIGVILDYLLKRQTFQSLKAGHNTTRMEGKCRTQGKEPR